MTGRSILRKLTGTNVRVAYEATSHLAQNHIVCSFVHHCMAFRTTRPIDCFARLQIDESEKSPTRRYAALVECIIPERVPNLNPPLPERSQLHWIPNLCQVDTNFCAVVEVSRRIINNYLSLTTSNGTPGGTLDPSTPSHLSVTTDATVAATVPTNAMTDSNRDCRDWYTVSDDQVRSSHT